MSGQDLALALRQQRILLVDCVQAMKEIGRKLAQAEHEYRKEYRKEVFRLRLEDGVAWTAATELARGDASIVAELRLRRDILRSDYDSLIEKTNCVKIEIRLLEGEIKYEQGIR